jgi:maltose alpha-D-glucosyltransferase/alpha-amylase
MRNQAVQTLQFLRSKLGVLDAASRAAAEQVLAREAEILRLLRAVYERRIAARRIRCHGDLHLGKTMHTGKDFIFFKFGGESSRPLGERRIKRSALRDVASLMRSFDYAASASLFQQVAAGALDEARLPQQQAWLSFWQRSVAVVFLRAYLEGMKPSPVLPSSSDELRILLQAHLLEKMMFEVSYELRHRPDWARIPLRAILGWMSATLA